MEQGILKREQGIISAEQGIWSAEQRKPQVTIPVRLDSSVRFLVAVFLRYSRIDMRDRATSDALPNVRI